MGNHLRVVGRPFPRGVSGNPGGRPKELRDVVELARAHGPEAIATLASIMRDPESPPAARVVAANAILDRGYGKPAQALAHVHVSDFDYMSDDDLQEFICATAKKRGLELTPIGRIDRVIVQPPAQEIIEARLAEIAARVAPSK